jgi:hypothetical protein
MSASRNGVPVFPQMPYGKYTMDSEYEHSAEVQNASGAHSVTNLNGVIEVDYPWSNDNFDVPFMQTKIIAAIAAICVCNKIPENAEVTVIIEFDYRISTQWGGYDIMLSGTFRDSKIVLVEEKMMKYD